VPVPQANNGNNGENPSNTNPNNTNGVSNKQFQSMQNITNYESGYSGGAGRGSGAGLPQGVNSPYVTKEDVTNKSEQLGKQINTIDDKQASLDSQAANGLISNSEYEQRSAELAAQRSDLATQQNIAQIHEAQVLEEAVNPEAYAQQQQTAAAEAAAWDTPGNNNTVVPGSTEDPYSAGGSATGVEPANTPYESNYPVNDPVQPPYDSGGYDNSAVDLSTGDW